MACPVMVLQNTTTGHAVAVQVADGDSLRPHRGQQRAMRGRKTVRAVPEDHRISIKGFDILVLADDELRFAVAIEVCGVDPVDVL